MPNYEYDYSGIDVLKPTITPKEYEYDYSGIKEREPKKIRYKPFEKLLKGLYSPIVPFSPTLKQVKTAKGLIKVGKEAREMPDYEKPTLQQFSRYGDQYLKNLYLGTVQTLHGIEATFGYTVPEWLKEISSEEEIKRLPKKLQPTWRKRNIRQQKARDAYHEGYMNVWKKHEEWVAARPELQKMAIEKGWDKPLLQIFRDRPEEVFNPYVYGHVISRGVVPTIAALAATTTTIAITKNPALALAVGAGVMFGPETDEVKKGMLSYYREQGKKLTPEIRSRVNNWSVGVGAFNALVEVISDIPMLAIWSAPFRKIFTKTFSFLLGKKLAPKIVGKPVGNAFIRWIIEMGEENVQETATDTAVQMETENRGLFESLYNSMRKIPETTLESAVIISPFVGLGIPADVRFHRNIRRLAAKQEVISDVEAKMSDERDGILPTEKEAIKTLLSKGFETEERDYPHMISPSGVSLIGRRPGQSEHFETAYWAGYTTEEPDVGIAGKITNGIIKLGWIRYDGTNRFGVWKLDSKTKGVVAEKILAFKNTANILIDEESTGITYELPYSEFKENDFRLPETFLKTSTGRFTAFEPIDFAEKKIIKSELERPKKDTIKFNREDKILVQKAAVKLDDIEVEETPGVLVPGALQKYRDRVRELQHITDTVIKEHEKRIARERYLPTRSISPNINTIARYIADQMGFKQEINVEFMNEEIFRQMSMTGPTYGYFSPARSTETGKVEIRVLPSTHQAMIDRAKRNRLIYQLVQESRARGATPGTETISMARVMEMPEVMWGHRNQQKNVYEYYELYNEGWKDITPERWAKEVLIEEVAHAADPARRLLEKYGRKMKEHIGEWWHRGEFFVFTKRKITELLGPEDITVNTVNNVMNENRKELETVLKRVFDDLAEKKEYWSKLTTEEKNAYEEDICLCADIIGKRGIPSKQEAEDMGIDDDELYENFRRYAARNAINTLFGVFPKGISFYMSWPTESAWALKNLPGQSQAQHQKAFAIIRKMMKEGRQYGLTMEDYITMFWPANQRTLLERNKAFWGEKLPGIKTILEIVDKVWTTELAKMKKKGILKEGFIERRTRLIQEEIVQQQAAYQFDETAANREARAATIRDLQAELKWFEDLDVRYVHFPIKLLFNDIYNDEHKRYALRFNRFFRERETTDIIALVEELLKMKYAKKEIFTKTLMREVNEGKAEIKKGTLTRGEEVIVSRPVLNREALDMRRIVAAYYDQLGRLYGVADIVAAFEHDKFIKNRPVKGIPLGWTSLPARYFKEFRGKIIKQEAGDWLEQYLSDAFKKGFALGRTMSYFKLMQFTKMFFMPAYDIYQAGVSWGLKWMLTRPWKIPGVVKKAIHSFVYKDKEYFNFYEYGAPSQPFSLSFQSFMNEINVMLKETGYQKMLETLRQHKIWSPIDIPYMFIWNMNWGGDRLVRLITYHALREEGKDPRMAADLTALAHSDYARVPASTRRVLNKIQFVPIFPITMAAFEYGMLKAGAQELYLQIRAGGAKLGLWKPPLAEDPRVKMMRRNKAASLLGWAGVVCLKEFIQKKLGYEPDLPLVSYKKEIDDPENPGQKKELVKYIATPVNILLRKFYRLSRIFTSADKWYSIAMAARSELYPIWAWMIDVAVNRKRDWTPIAEWDALILGSPKDKLNWVYDQLKYMDERLVPLLKETWERMPGVETEREKKRKIARKEYRKAAPWILKLFDTFFFIYIKNTTKERQLRAMRELEKALKASFRTAMDRGESEAQMKRFEYRIKKLQEKIQNVFDVEEKEEEEYQYDYEGL